MPPAGEVIVPEGHSVTEWRITTSPGVHVTAHRLVVAELGAGTDDPSEVMFFVDQATRALAERSADPSRPATHFVREAKQLSDLFAPAMPPTEEVRDGVVWVVGPEGLWPMLRDRAETERLLDAFRRVSSARARQWLVVDAERAPEAAFESALGALGIEILRAAPGQPFLLDVRRPDQRHICAFAACPPAVPPAVPARAGARSLARAPRLRKLLLDAIVHGGRTSALFDELLSRKAGLAFFVRPDRKPETMSWPSAPSPHLALYADRETLERTARELARPPGSFLVGALPPRELFACASRDGVGVAFGVFPEDGAVCYLTVDPATLANLMPGSRAAGGRPTP